MLLSRKALAYLGGLLICVFLISLFCWVLLPIFYPPAYFYTAWFYRPTWISSTTSEFDNVRGRMCGDLRRRYLRPGMRREEVIRLLGKPDGFISQTEIGTLSSPESGNASQAYRYFIGMCESMDGWSLDIGFDRDGRLTSTWLTQY
jgi:hypothetical protein